MIKKAMKLQLQPADRFMLSEELDRPALSVKPQRESSTCQLTIVLLWQMLLQCINMLN